MTDIMNFSMLTVLKVSYKMNSSLSIISSAVDNLSSYLRPSSYLSSYGALLTILRANDLALKYLYNDMRLPNTPAITSKVDVHLTFFDLLVTSYLAASIFIS